MIRTLLRPGKETDLIGIDLADIPAGETLTLQRDEELVAMVLGGVADVSVDGTTLGKAGGRAGVFESPGHAVYAPPQATISLAASGPVSLAIATAPLADAPAAPARLIAPEDQDVAHRGNANSARTVRTVLGPNDAAGRLLLGETINPPGNWSSYPPHKHDTEVPPEEVRLEETYLFKVDPPGGFGIQLRYEDGGGDVEECFSVRDGDTAAIKSGYHPVVAAPGYSLYYLWAMAGDGRAMIPRFDPRHAWAQDS